MKAFNGSTFHDGVTMEDKKCTELMGVTARTDQRANTDRRRSRSRRKSGSSLMATLQRHSFMGNSNLPVWQQLVFLMLAALPGFMLFAGITYEANNKNWEAQEKFNIKLERKVDTLNNSIQQTDRDVFVLKKNWRDENR